MADNQRGELRFTKLLVKQHYVLRLELNRIEIMYCKLFFVQICRNMTKKAKINLPSHHGTEIRMFVASWNMTSLLNLGLAWPDDDTQLLHRAATKL